MGKRTYDYYSIDKIDSKGALFNAIIAGRDSGKTIAIKKRMVQEALDGRRFVYVRRNKVESQSRTMEAFFEKMQVCGYYNDLDLSYEKEMFYLNDEPIGYSVPLSTSSNVRSMDFINVWDIYFEEFVLQEDRFHTYLPDEVTKFLDLYKTVARDDREVRAWFIGNKIQEYNPYFLYFDIIPPKAGIKVYNDFAVEVWQSKKFEESKKSTRFGKLINGTDFSRYAIDNQSYVTNFDFVRKKPKGSKPIFNVLYMGQLYGFWSDGRNLYLSEQSDNKRTTYGITPQDASPENLNVKGFSLSPCGILYKNCVKKNSVFYETAKTEEVGRAILKHVYMR